MKRNLFYVIILSFAISISCKQGNGEMMKLFSKMDNKAIGIDFRNTITDTADLTLYDSDLIYAGAGVSIGDINNDGLTDVFMVGNQVPSKLYLNKGDFKFENITGSAGISTKGWCTGSTMADVNGDGYLDIYVCIGGFKQEPEKRNLLYINNKDLTFTESAKEWGVDDNGVSYSASFFDYDNDGDLDLFVVNSPDDIKKTFQIPFYKDPDLLEKVNCNQLYENVGDKFVNATEKSRIGYRNADSFQASIADINNDGNLDIYVNNDLLQPDFLFVNKGDGTFAEEMNLRLNAVPMFSMGSTFTDFNNDGLLDLATTEMMPPSHKRRKNNMPHPDVEFYDYIVHKTFESEQHSRNMLQIQNPDGTFSEVGEMANVSRTDWSWATLGCDFDNDGFQDLLITNGVKKDVFDQTYLSLAFEGKEFVEHKYSRDAKELIKNYPVHLEEDYVFKNLGNLTFEKKTEDWGLSAKTASQGAAYGDLNNDGYPEVIISNSDSFALVYKNNGKMLENNNFLKVSFKGADKNTFGLGTKVRLYYQGKTQYQQLQNSQGWQSSSEPVMFFGLGRAETVDSIEVVWLNGKMETVYKPKANQHLVFHQEKATRPAPSGEMQYKNTLFRETNLLSQPFVHREKPFIDFRRDKLIPKMVSREGPGIAVGDVNRDGMEDFYIGGASGQSGMLNIQQKDGSFVPMFGPWQDDSMYEDMSAIFVDINGDKYLDLYVTSGSNEFSNNSPWLKDRVYMNRSGKGFEKDNKVLKSKTVGSKSIIKAADIDSDGDMDLFVGGRVNNERYPTSPENYILVNENGTLVDRTEEVCKGLKRIGMVMDAKFADLNGDGKQDFIVTGEWMPVSIFIQSNKKLVNKTKQYGLDKSNGWWNSIALADFNNDGKLDIVAGNYGHNTVLKPNKKEPIVLYYGDYDNNKSAESILCYYHDGILAPYADRDLILRSIPSLTNKFLTYKSYGESDIHDILTAEQIKSSEVFNAYTFTSTIFMSDGKKYVAKALPNEAQVAPLYGMITMDYNNDGKKDIVIAGNSYSTGYEDGPMAASRGLVLKGNGDGTFQPVRSDVSGISINADMKSAGLVYLSSMKKYGLLVGINNGPLRTYVMQASLNLKDSERQLGSGYLYNYSRN